MSKTKSQLISICGSGRSGTHLIGRVLSTHPSVDGRIEDPNFFKLSKKIASTQDYTFGFLTKLRKRSLINRYRRELSKVKVQYLLDKSHPNMWIANELNDSLEAVKFVGIKRDVRQTVASMKNHVGVQQWYKILPQDKFNRFLGITEANRAHFSSMSLIEKCVFRIVSHHKELDKLNQQMNNFHLIEYNNLMTNYDDTIAELAHFLGIENVFAPESFNHDSLVKWKTELDEKELNVITDICQSNSIELI